LAARCSPAPTVWPASGDTIRCRGQSAQELSSSCYCGQRGCVETWISGPALTRDHRSVAGIDLSAVQIATRGAQGDAACIATLERYEERLARALAFVINLLDPDVIVLGGGLSQMQRLYTNVPLRWHTHVVSGGVKDVVRTRLVRSRHGDSSGVRGAAWLWGKPEIGSP
jgi:predicted NBD/HSP70 family sugar kinase